jgi:hypothetical protein
LNAAEVRVNDPRQRFDRQRLRGTRHTFDECMPLGEKSNEDLLNRIILPYDNFSQFASNVIDCGGDVFNHLFW